ncbi:MAG: hypothetical protein NZM42_15205, partial [Gemmatales bacterium]|nr:hypothetical protein [Gemmatales bacterium]
FAQVHCERVFVHALDAVRDDVADGGADEFWCGFVLCGADAREFATESACCGEQEVTAAAGWIADAEREQSVFGERLGE